MSPDRNRTERDMLTTSLRGMRSLSPEWDALFGSTASEAYDYGVRAGVLLAQVYSAKFTVFQASEHALRHALDREADQIRYPPNPQFEDELATRLKDPNNPTRDIVDRARNLYDDTIGQFGKQQPYVAKYIYSTSLASGHRTREPLINLGIMDTLDTYYDFARHVVSL